MSKALNVLERSVIHKDKVFIKAGEENTRAYVIQKGKVRAFVMDGDEKIVVAEHGPGTIIGEICLLLDDPIQLNYEAMMDTTVVTITRQDFEKKLRNVDKSVKTILNYVMEKLHAQARDDIKAAEKKAYIEDESYDFVKALIMDMKDEAEKFRYEKALLGPVNELIKTLKKLKKRANAVTSTHSADKQNEAGQRTAD